MSVVIEEIRDRLDHFGISKVFFCSYVGINPNLFSDYHCDRREKTRTILRKWNDKLQTFAGALGLYSDYQKYVLSFKNEMAMKRTGRFSQSEIDLIKNK